MTDLKLSKHTNNFIVLAAFFLIFQVLAVFNENVFLINSWLLQLLSFVFFPVVFFIIITSNIGKNKFLALDTFVISMLFFLAKRIDTFSPITLVLPLVLMLITELIYYYSKSTNSKTYLQLKPYKYLALTTFLIHLIFNLI